MFSEELEMLIEGAIADGEISEKERSILHKRAQAEGVDIDELDMIVDARIAKAKKAQRDSYDEEEIDEETKLKYLLGKFEEIDAMELENDIDKKGNVTKFASTKRSELKEAAIKNFQFPSDRKSLKEVIVHFNSHNKFMDQFYRVYHDKYKELVQIVLSYFPEDEEMLSLVGKGQKEEKKEKKGFFGGLFGKKS